jgi:hypothetical protein
VGEGLNGADRAAAVPGELFPSLVARDVALAEERRLGAFDEGLERLSEAVGRAVGRERSWLSRLRAGIVAFLAFFEDEPGWGRVLVGEAPMAQDALAGYCRAGVLGVLRGLLEDRAPRRLGELTPDPRLTSELIAGGVLSVVRGCVLEEDEGEAQPLVELAPSLMAFVVGPYLGQVAASVELSGRPAPTEERGAAGRRLYVTRRTSLVLRAIASAPRSSNRGLAQAAGLADEGQTSKLLRRLAERGLIENVGFGQRGGRTNAWVLSSRGEQMLARLGQPAGERRSA